MGTDSLAQLSIQFDTPRFTVRTLLDSDVGDGYGRWFSDPVVREFIAWRPGEDPIGELRRFASDHFNRSDSLLLGVFDGSGQHVANLKYEPVDLPKGEAVLGVLIGHPDWRGKGLFCEVFAVSSEALAQRYGVRRFLLGVDAGNLAALTAYTRAGFRPLEIESFDRAGDGLQGTPSGPTRMVCTIK
jgi:RimJ/RimL family protein N-acetyltransferase